MSVPIRRRGASISALMLVLAASMPAAAIGWQPPQPLTTSGQVAAEPASTVAYEGGTAVIYRELVEDVYRVYVRRSTDGGTTWTAPRRLSSPNWSATGASLAARGSKLDAVFKERRAGGAWRVIYRSSTDGGLTWSAPVALSPPGVRAGVPSVARRQYTVAIAWTNELTGEVSVRVKHDGDATFGRRMEIAMSRNRPSGDAFDAFPTVAITLGCGAGVIDVAYYTSRQTIELRRFGTCELGGIWTAPKTLAGTGNGRYKPVLRASVRGDILLAFARGLGSDVHTAYRDSIDGGYTYGPVFAVSGSSAPPSYHPVAETGSGRQGGRWHFAFERCLDESCQQSAVYYRLGTPTGEGLPFTWSPTKRVDDGSNDHQTPVGATSAVAPANCGRIVTFLTFDPAAQTSDFMVSRTAEAC